MGHVRGDRDSRLCKVTDIWHLLHLVVRRAATGYCVVCSYLLERSFRLFLYGLTAERAYFLVKRGIHY